MKRNKSAPKIDGNLSSKSVKDSPKDTKIFRRIKKIVIKNKRNGLPKNFSEYRHVISSPEMKGADVSWILKLRGYNKTSKDKKNINFSPPKFYEEDLEKYKEKVKKERRVIKNFPKGNLTPLYHIIKRNSNTPLNNSQFLFETTLRFDKKESHNKNHRPWYNCIPSPSQTQQRFFETFLPPLLKTSKQALRKMQNYISHPVERKTISKSLSTGKLVEQRISTYEMNKTLRYPSEHFPSSIYKNESPRKNYNEVKHIFDNTHSNDFIQWQGELREYKFSPSSIKNGRNKR